MAHSPKSDRSRERCVPASSRRCDIESRPPECVSETSRWAVVRAGRRCDDSSDVASASYLRPRRRFEIHFRRYAPAAPRVNGERRDHRHGNAPRQHPRRYRRRRMAVPEHEQTLPPMVLPMRYPGRPPPTPPPGAGSKVRAAAPRRHGGVGARITAIVPPPRRPPFSRVGRSSHQNSAPRREPVDLPERRGRLRSPGSAGPTVGVA